MDKLLEMKDRPKASRHFGGTLFHFLRWSRERGPLACWLRRPEEEGEEGTVASRLRRSRQEVVSRSHLGSTNSEYCQTAISSPSRRGNATFSDAALTTRFYIQKLPFSSTTWNLGGTGLNRPFEAFNLKEKPAPLALTLQ